MIRQLFLVWALMLTGSVTAWACPEAIRKDPMKANWIYCNTFEPAEPRDVQFLGKAQLTLSVSFGGHRGASEAHQGRGFVRLAPTATGEWAAMIRWQTVRAGDSCTFAVWVKTSATLTEGFVRVWRDGEQRRMGEVLTERALTGARPAGDPKDNGYELVDLRFPTNNSTKLWFYVGMFGNGKDSWIELDDVAILCDRLGPSEAPPNGTTSGRPQRH